MITLKSQGQSSVIRRSVGRGGANAPEDVSAVQKLLNSYLVPPTAPLDVNGICGPKTVAAIVQFQRTRVGLRRGDGRVDPHGPTLAKMVQVSETPAPPKASPMPANFEHYKLEAHAVFIKEGHSEQERDQYEKFAETVKEVSEAGAQAFFVFETAEKAEKCARFYLFLSRWGLDKGDIVRLIVVWVRGSPTAATSAIIEEIIEPASVLAKSMKYFGVAGKLVEVVEQSQKACKAYREGQYGETASIIYKLAMGTALPIAGFFDGLEGLVGYLLEKAGYKDPRLFKYLRIANPIGLGGVGVDAMITCSAALVDLVKKGRVDETRFEKLVKRMKDSPAHLFVEMGDKLGDSIYDISRMSSAEIDEMLSWKSVSGWARYLVTGKMPDER